MKRIIVATDGSDGSNRAVDAAAELAKTTNADLVIVTVGGNVTGAELRRLASTDGDLPKTLEAKADRVLRQAGRRARRQGIRNPILRCGWGPSGNDPLFRAARKSGHDRGRPTWS